MITQCTIVDSGSIVYIETLSCKKNCINLYEALHYVQLKQNGLYKNIFLWCKSKGYDSNLYNCDLTNVQEKYMRLLSKYSRCPQNTSHLVL